MHVCVLWCVHMGLPLSNPAGARVGSRRAQLRKTKLTINLGKIIKVLQDVPHPRLPTGKGGLHTAQQSTVYVYWSTAIYCTLRLVKDVDLSIYLKEAADRYIP